MRSKLSGTENLKGGWLEVGGPLVPPPLPGAAGLNACEGGTRKGGEERREKWMKGERIGVKGEKSSNSVQQVCQTDN